jgi:outer membrane protein OmpA-like peptidoglycan-associated protein
MTNRTSQLYALTLGLFLLFAQNALAQTAGGGASASTRSAAAGQKMTIKGVVVRREADTFTVRDINDVDTVVRLTDATRVSEKKSNPFRRARNYATTTILRGLNVEVKGRGDASGQLVAENVRFSDEEFKVARTIESRVNPVENRVGSAEGRIGQVEQNAQRMSGQLDELAAISNAARGGAKAAQETADAAVAGVNATNERITALDDYEASETLSINFRSGSAVLTADSKSKLDSIAQKAASTKGYVLEVSGFTDAVGGLDYNRRLSARRADAVIRYLVENHRIPLRRIITPYGYGESNAVAENTSRTGRAQNRRVEVKLLVNKGLTAPAPSVTSSVPAA